MGQISHLSYSSNHHINLGYVRLKLAQYFWRKKIFKCRQCILTISLLHVSPLEMEKDGALYLNKLEFLSPNNAFYQVWIKLAQWHWRKRQCIMCTFYNFSLERDMVFHLHRLESPAPPEIFCCQVSMKSVLWF